MAQSGGDAVEKLVEHSKLEELKRLKKIYFLTVECHRGLFRDDLVLLIKDWKEQLPNLLDIFTKQEIDWLLVATVKAIVQSQEIIDFFIRCGYKDEPDLDKEGKPILRRITAVNQIDNSSYWNSSKVSKSKVLENLFKIYDKFHVNYTDESGCTHFHMACKHGLDNVVEKFLELGQDPNCLQPKTGDSILHLFATRDLTCPMERIIQLLLNHGADPNLANKNGSTPLHVICENRSYGAYSVFSMLLESIDEFQQTMLIDAKDKWGDTPLLLATSKRNAEMVASLLRRGADPNLANEDGKTLLHVICQSDKNEDLLKLFLKVNDEIENTVQIDARDNEGNTPLHLATSNGNTEMVASLLRRGVDPTLANAKRLTPLHVICQSEENGCLLWLFFVICDEFGNTVQIDAQDNEGNTPLHLATSCDGSWMVEPLLRRGADPCAANTEGLTPLLITARRDVDGRVMKLFFSEERQWMVGIDARDDKGRTALEWAVTRCWPHIVESLLDRGADLSGFVFPTPSDSDGHGVINVGRSLENPGNDGLNRDYSLTKLIAATGLLAIVELLEARGYEMSRDDALKFMGFFDKYGLFGSTDFLASKEVDDLVDSLFKKMGKNPTYMNDYKFASSYKLRELPRESMEFCSLRLCEKVSTKFFRDWALVPFMELIHYRLLTELSLAAAVMRARIEDKKLQYREMQHSHTPPDAARLRGRVGLSLGTRRGFTSKLEQCSDGLAGIRTYGATAPYSKLTFIDKLLGYSMYAKENYDLGVGKADVSDYSITFYWLHFGGFCQCH
ncbi:unnamed protein product [Trichogramma brassicae]|uniref:Uncharacterized protein n=1 Tax=Trichogramma brassicae TaxID=86971 RepID=A0A6H5IJ00_9HYME|nr:unnamed protein product [Trichogramma brassicae]